MAGTRRCQPIARGSRRPGQDGRQRRCAPIGTADDRRGRQDLVEDVASAPGAARTVGPRHHPDQRADRDPHEATDGQDDERVEVKRGAGDDQRRHPCREDRRRASLTRS